MNAILGVHGVRNWDPDRAPAEAAKALAERWAGWFGASERPFHMAYYAHHLRLETDQGVDDPETLDPELRMLLSDWAVQLLREDDRIQGRGTLPVRQAIEIMARWGALGTKPVGAFVAIFLRELRTYFRHRDARLAARREVADGIERTGARTVLAHSLGSVVAYEALRERVDLSLDLLVTMGSPLGMPNLVIDKLEPAGVEGKALPNVRCWVNVADPGDLCAIPRRLGKVFAGIDHDPEVPIGTFAFHEVARYLNILRAVLTDLPGRPHLYPITKV